MLRKVILGTYYSHENAVKQRSWQLRLFGIVDVSDNVQIINHDNTLYARSDMTMMRGNWESARPVYLETDTLVIQTFDRF